LSDIPLSSAGSELYWREKTEFGKSGGVKTLNTYHVDTGDGTTEPAWEYYHTRTKILHYVPVNGEYLLEYTIEPDQYDAWMNSDQSQPRLYASSFLTYYALGPYAGKVKTTSSSACSCMEGEEYEYAEGELDIMLYKDGQPTDEYYKPPIRQTKVYQSSAAGRALTTVYQLNANGQTVFALRRATDTTGWLMQYNYNHDTLGSLSGAENRLEEAIEWSVDFDWTGSDLPTNLLSPKRCATNHVQIGGRQYGYGGAYEGSQSDNLQLCTSQEDFQGLKTDGTPDYAKVYTWLYVYDGDTYTKLRKTSTAWLAEEPDVTLTTTFYYDVTGRLYMVRNPLVTTAESNHHTGKKMTFDEKDRITSLRQVRFTPGSSDPVDELVTTYTYDEDLNYCYEQTKTVIDPGDANLETRYTYTIAGGKWRKSEEIVEMKSVPDLVTTYTYSGASGAYGNPTNIAQPEDEPEASHYIQYHEEKEYDLTDRVVSSTRRCMIDRSEDTDYVVGRTTYVYNLAGKVIRQTDGSGGAEAVTTEWNYDPIGRLQSVTNGITSRGIMGNVIRHSYYTGTCRVMETYQGAGSGGAGTLVSKFEYSVDGKTLATTDAMGRVSRNTYTGAGFLEKVYDPQSPNSNNKESNYTQRLA